MKQYTIFVELKYKDIGVGGILDDMVASTPEQLKNLIATQKFTNSAAYNRFLGIFLQGCRNAGYKPIPTKAKFLICAYNGISASLENTYGGYEFDFTPIGGF